MEKDELQLIRSLSPFKDMDAEDFKGALSKAKILNVPKGKMVFKRNEDDTKVYWLVSGALDLLDENFEAKNRKAGDEVAMNPIDNNNPHNLTAVSTEEARLLTIERSELSVLGGDPVAAEEEEEEGVDWMSTLLSSPLFEFIPPANIQTLFGKFEEVQYKTGDNVIKQGDQGDYFYVIQAGRAKVERTSGDKTITLAELHAGDNFGQDALVSDVPRNATVTMTSNGTLMRLSEDDFESLLMAPVIERVNWEEAQEMVKAGDPRTYIIDVRNPQEVESDKMAGALNVPLLLIRKNIPKLKPDSVYVMADGETGKRAQLGAYLLNEAGFTAYVLKND